MRSLVVELDGIIVSGKSYGDANASDIVLDILVYARERGINAWPDESLAYLGDLRVYWALVAYWSVSAMLTRIAELAGLTWQVQWSSDTTKAIVTFSRS